MFLNDYVKPGLTIKSSKVSLCRNKLSFLGHQISEKGVEPDPHKLNVIRHWLRPENTKDLRAFLGLCNYYYYPFEVSTNASDTGIGCILSQRDSSGRDQPVLFASKV